MSHLQTRTRPLLGLLATAAIACLPLAGCGVLIPVSKVEAPPSVDDDSKAKSAPCQAQGQDSRSSADCKGSTPR